MVEFIPDRAERILDAGCGAGLFGEGLKKTIKREIWGIEMDLESANLAKQRIDKVIVGDISTSIKMVPDSYFDCVVFNDVLEHLVDPWKILMDTKGKLNAGGVVVCSVPNVRYLFLLKDLLFNRQWKYESFGVLDKTHLRYFTKDSISDMFISLDYEVLKIKGINGIKSWKFNLLNLVSFGGFADSKYLQFACVAKPKRQ